MRLSSSILVSRRSSASFSSFLIWDSKSFSFHSAGADHSAVSALRETDREEALLLVVSEGYIWGEEIQEQNLVRKFASSGGGKEKFTQACPMQADYHRNCCVVRVVCRSVLSWLCIQVTLIARCHAALLRLLFPAFFFSRNAAFASALPTDLAFATARRWVPFRPSSPSIRTVPSSKQPTDQRDGERTHEGEGAKAAAPPMRARMARTRMVEVDGGTKEKE